jgi:threonylcarbamoyladenosine tRNA methylthiotransferase MtaB
MKVFFNTFGCKTNQYDSALLGQTLEQSGFTLTDSLDSADWVVVNTCAVTKRGEDKACQWVRKLGREYPQARIAVVGCSVEVSAGRFSELPGVSLLLGTEEKFRLGEVLAELEQNRGRSQAGLEPASGMVRTIERYSQKSVLTAHRNHARAFVKVQDGCNNRCTYCIVPFVRGASRSRPLEQLVAEVRALEARGHREVVLTGIHIGQYGLDLAEPLTLADLVEKVLVETGQVRIRLSSVEVGEIDERLVEMLSSQERLCRHLHIPLQHGSHTVLQRMGRKYSPGEFRGRVERISESLPGLGLGTDVIAGFPGETESEFSECLDFIDSMPFTYLHVFPFSPRPGTEAARLNGRLRKEEIRRRVKIMRELSNSKKEAFLRSLAGKTLSVVHESELPSGVSVCRADNYARIYYQGNSPGCIFDLIARQPWRDGVWAELRRQA